MTREDFTVAQRLGRPRLAALCETQTIEGDGGTGKGKRFRDDYLSSTTTITQPAITITTLFIEESFQDVSLSFFIHHY